MSEEKSANESLIQEDQNPWGGEIKRFVQEFGYPEPLAKACVDNIFSYALGLKDGTVFEFSGVKAISPDWVELHFQEEDVAKNKKFGNKFFSRFCFERGILLRVAEILWCADAPHGS